VVRAAMPGRVEFERSGRKSTGGPSTAGGQGWREWGWQAVDKVDAWMRTRVIEDVPALRRRHSETLEQLSADCLRKWNASDQVGMAEQARKFLTDLRRLWNVDLQVESESSEESESMDWPPGMTRDEALRHQITLLQEALRESEDQLQAAV
jgi:phage-related baseplate assembly protein